jgi:ABC-2 type transport system ATP-binding protein
MAAAGDQDEEVVAVSARGLVKSYGDIQAVRAIDLEVRSGETFGFLGPNGAGKSTTISMLCTLLTPTAGTAQVAGFDVVHQRDDVRRHIGLVFQDQTLDGYLSAQMNLRLHGELYGVPGSVLPDRIERILKMVGLWDRRKSKVNTGVWKSAGACSIRPGSCSSTSPRWAWTRRPGCRSGPTSGS